jgi:hypothetical protein
MNAEIPDAPAPGQRKRRWWLYLLIAMGGLFCLTVLVVVLVFSYYKSLVRNYTTAKPAPLPKVEFDPQRQKALQARWTEFAESLQRRQNPSPFVITADDINSFLSQNKEMRNVVGFVVTNNQVLAKFSAPLDKMGQKDLKGRYFNGQAKVDINFQDGWLTVSLGSVEANGKTVPSWMLKRIQQGNPLKDLDRNRDLVNLFHELESVRVEGDKIVLTPWSPSK